MLVKSAHAIQHALVKRLPAWLFGRNPAAALWLTRRFSGVYRGPRRLRMYSASPHRAEIVRVLGPMSRERQKLIREKIARTHALNAVVTQVERSLGPEALQPIIEVEGEGGARIRRLLEAGPAPIITTWHIGPRAGVWAFLSRYPLRLMKMQFTEWKVVPEGWTLIPGPSDAMMGAGLIRRIKKHLAGGGWAAFAFDKTHRGTRVHRVEHFGRDVTIKSAIGAVSQITGAPVVLISSRWNEAGTKIRVTVHEPLHPDGQDAEAESRLVRTLAGQMEAYVRAHPWEQSAVRYRRILAFPKIGEEPADAPSTASGPG